ncbi:MAG: hypothetical protein MK214_10850 [Thalassotalea sp.]|nr:hypothetical protein [Thalassotalea sp.]
MDLFLAGLLIFAFAVFWFIPIAIVLKSSRIEGNTKTLWLVVVICFSWIACLTYLFITPKPQKAPATSK